MEHVDHSKRIENEKEFGKFLLQSGAEEIWHWDTPTGRIRAQQRFEKIVNAIEPNSSSKILEYGCGTGIFSRKLLTTGATITAIDISADLLERAEELTEKSSKISFDEADAMNTPFDKNTFDAVVGVSVLHHLEFEKAFQEINRILKPGGILAFSEPNYLNPHIWLERSSPKMRSKFNVSPDESAFVRFTLKPLMKQCGFTDISIRPFDFLHPITPVRFIPTVKKLSDILSAFPILNEIAGSLFIQARKG